MLYMLRIFIFFIIAFVSCKSWSSPNNIIASIRPLQSIIANITKNIDSNIGLVVDTNESIHNYNLKPLKAKEIIKSKFIIIIDKDFEVFLDKIYKKIAQRKKNLIEVAKTPGIDLIESDHHHEEDEHHHHHSIHDYHIWLDVSIVKKIAKNLTETFSITDKKNRDLYYKNLAEFITKLNTLDNNIKEKLSDIKDKEFVVTHNAYRYFINRYNLKQPTTLTIDHDHNIGAGDFINIQEDLKSGKIKCIFEEPQFESSIIRKLGHTYKNVKIGVLDAEWGDSTAKIEDNYFVIMNNLAESFKSCLK